MEDSGLVVREEFGARELAVRAETSAAAVVAQARAAVEARYVVALQRPRDIDAARVRLLHECQRPGFAEVARYAKPVGGRAIEGPSVRFAEAAIRCMGNILPETSTLYDDDEKRIVRVAVTDLETNVTYSKDIVVQKTVERRNPKEGQRVMGTRTNTSGQAVYLVAATEDDLLNKEAALASKALRGLALRLLPGDILDECMEAVQKTLRDRAAKDPDAERKRLIDAFAALKILPARLAQYLGHPLEEVTPAELAHLRGVYQAVRDGETSWHELLEQHAEAKEPGKAGSKVSTLKDHLKREKKAKEVIHNAVEPSEEELPPLGQDRHGDVDLDAEPGARG